MTISRKLCAVALMFAVFSAGIVGAAAFLPLEKMAAHGVDTPASGHSIVHA